MDSRTPRWVALVLLALGIGALLHPEPLVVSASDGGPRLVLQSGSAAAALPSSSLVEGAESGDSPTSTLQRRGNAPVARGHTYARTILRGPSHPALARHRTGAALLGLYATPANAPPLA